MRGGAGLHSQNSAAREKQAKMVVVPRKATTSTDGSVISTASISCPIVSPLQKPMPARIAPRLTTFVLSWSMPSHSMRPMVATSDRVPPKLNATCAAEPSAAASTVQASAAYTLTRCCCTEGVLRGEVGRAWGAERGAQSARFLLREGTHEVRAPTRRAPRTCHSSSSSHSGRSDRDC